MSSTEDKKCPECGAAVAPIRIIDHDSYHTGKLRERDLDYTLPGAKGRFWSSLPVEGIVAAYMCSACARIVLYGKKKNE